MAPEAPHGPRVVVGIDGSSTSVAAVRWALEYARATGGTLKAVHAWQLPRFFGAPSPATPRPDPRPMAEQVVATAVDRAAGGMPPGVPVERRVMAGDPGRTLVEEARDADLLVVGSHGHGAVMGALLGSVSYHCVEHAPCPVVVVRHA